MALLGPLLFSYYGVEEPQQQIQEEQGNLSALLICFWDSGVHEWKKQRVVASPSSFLSPTPTWTF